MTGKDSVKQHYQRKKIFTVTQTWILLMQITHTKRVCNDFEIKNLGEYHDLHVQSDTLLLADVFNNFQKTYLEIYGLDLVCFLLAPGLAWQAALKKTNIKLDLWTDIDMLLMVGKGIRGGTCHAIHQ